MRAKQLFTIGYEGADLADFLATLAAGGVAQVIDIRDVAISRKRGFSKNALSDALAAKGIAYVHLKALGNPKPGREAARRGEFAAFRNIYDQHLKEPDAQAALKDAARRAGGTVSCLMCFERANEHCHRTIVAVALAEKAGFAIRHLGVRKDAASHRRCDYDRSSDR
ncbi:MAG: DUF488 domain-containing protein [Pseudomonadota bacterium]